MPARFSSAFFLGGFLLPFRCFLKRFATLRDRFLEEILDLAIETAQLLLGPSFEGFIDGRVHPQQE